MTWEKSAVYALTPTITSIFQANNISGVLTTVLSILQTALQPMYSKLSDMTGRAEAYTISIVFFIVSFIIMACAQNYNTLIGGQVIYAFGFSGTLVLGPILIGDMTDIVNRSMFLALYNFPTIINLFAASAAAQKFLETNWRWGYAHVCIVMLVTSAPLIFGLWRIQRKAKQTDLLKESHALSKSTHQRTFAGKVLWLCIEIDLVGSILLAAGLFLILLPLVLANNWGGWGSSTTIGTLCAGGGTWILFAVWEKRFASKPIIPLTNWESRNPVWGVLVVFLIAVINNMMDFQYFLTYLQVTRRLTSQNATYLERGFNVTYVCLPLVIGYTMKRTRRWRPYVWIGASFAVLGPGLMIPARSSHSHDAFIVISQVIFGAATAFINYPILVGIQASVPPKDIAIVIALYEVGTSVAASIGTTIAGSVWNSVLPALFEKHVPGNYQYAKIVQSISFALALPKDQYQGVVLAYDDAMRLLGIIAVFIGALSFLASVPLKGFLLVDSKANESDSQENVQDGKTLDEEISVNEGIVISHVFEMPNKKSVSTVNTRI
ncbi:major facilitator superfamily domain-containing protein [Mucor lusitanicus]|nr:major facilitator superfamily domain-containing protein [Mucor lusitanicus]